MCHNASMQTQSNVPPVVMAGVVALIVTDAGGQRHTLAVHTAEAAMLRCKLNAMAEAEGLPDYHLLDRDNNICVKAAVH